MIHKFINRPLEATGLYFVDYSMYLKRLAAINVRDNCSIDRRTLTNLACKKCCPFFYLRYRTAYPYSIFRLCGKLSIDVPWEMSVPRFTVTLWFLKLTKQYARTFYLFVAKSIISENICKSINVEKQLVRPVLLNFGKSLWPMRR